MLALLVPGVGMGGGDAAATIAGGFGPRQLIAGRTRGRMRYDPTIFGILRSLTCLHY